MNPDSNKDSTAAFERSVEDRFGVLPNFFRLTPDAPEVSRNLWGFAQFAYLDNPLPSLFKERLFVYLSQFCDARYCITRHVGFLTGLGRPSGDKQATPETVEQVVRLLERPLPGGEALDAHIDFLSKRSSPLESVPAPTDDAEESVFACASHVFLQSADATRSLRALKKALDAALLQHLLAFLTFVRTAHFWSKIHPELQPESDIEELLSVQDALSKCVLDNAGTENAVALRSLRKELDDLRREEADLQSRAGQSRFLASIIESSEDAIYSKSLDGTIQSWNSSAERMFGYSEEQVVGQQVFVLIPEDRIAEEEQTLKQVADGERVSHFDTLRRHASGENIPVALTVSPIKDEAGNIIAASAIARDITNQKQTAKALLESEDRVRAALEAAELGTWNLLDPETMELQTDQRFNEIFGSGVVDAIKYEAAIGRIHPDDQQRVQDAVNAAINPDNPMPYEIEYRVVWPDDSIHWVFAKGRARFATKNGVRRLLSFDGTVMDVTEQRTLREELREVAAKLSEADRRKDEFLATLAHELRNPLAPIRTGLDAIGMADADADARQRILHMMVRQTEHIVHLVDDLLDISRITRGSMQLRRSRIDLATCVRSAVEATSALMDDAGHNLTVTVPEGPLPLHADPTRVAQILSNLLNNAGKYTAPGGAVWLTVDASDDEYVISVRDNGKGIEPGMQTTIFELFGQVSRVQDEQSQSGLGIGLTLVKSLVEMHGGSISVSSAGVDQGSTFTVRLPRENQPAQVMQNSAQAEQSTSLRVLVVDDNKEAAETMAMLIELYGNEVRTAHDGKQAVEVASEYLPDVIFMDIGMPRMNGIEAARAIRAERWGGRTKLVALTGWGQKAEKRRTRDAGFDAHLVKPVASETIQELLAEYSGSQ